LVERRKASTKISRSTGTVSDSLTDLLVQALNISLMLAVGFELELKRIKTLLLRGWLLLYALFLNFAVVPFLGWGLVQILPLGMAVGTGLILVAISPGGGTGTLLTKMARADLELSVVMLFPLTALSVLITPFLARLLLGSQGSVELSMAAMWKTLILFQLLPLVAGISGRALSETWAARGRRIMSPLANALLAVLVVGLLVTRGDKLLDFSASAVLGLALLATAAIGVGLLNGLDRRQRIAMSLTTGVRSVSLSLLIASAFFPDPKTILTVLTFALFMYGVGIPLALKTRPP
jgi:BASS family bile acid:Na+ symporter